MATGLLNDTKIVHLETLGKTQFQISCQNLTGNDSDTIIGEEVLKYGANYQIVYVEHDSTKKVFTILYYNNYR